MLRTVQTRGSTLIVVLLLLTVLLLLGMAFLTQQSHLFGASSQAQFSVVARALAEAGLEDARVKLEKDPNFPPPADPNQPVFTYSEQVTNITNTENIGQYSVSIDVSKRESNEIIAVTSIGSVGDNANTQRVLYAELDLSGDLGSNSHFFRFVHFEDRGAL